MPVEQGPFASTSAVFVVRAGSLWKNVRQKLPRKRCDKDLWSKVKFPVEKPPNKDFSALKDNTEIRGSSRWHVRQVRQLASSRLQDMGLEI